MFVFDDKDNFRINLRRSIQMALISKIKRFFSPKVIKPNNKYIHIGNIKLGSIDFNHKRADISYFIGEKKFQGRGIAKKAISEIILIAKKKFNLKKISAGVYSQNKASIKVLKSNGFKREATLKSHIIFNSKRYNSYIYGYVIK